MNGDRLYTRDTVFAGIIEQMDWMENTVGVKPAYLHIHEKHSEWAAPMAEELGLKLMPNTLFEDAIYVTAYPDVKAYINGISRNE